MKKFTVRIPPHLQAPLRHPHPLLKSKIRKALEALEKDPYAGKPLKEHLQGYFSYRVSQYRIVYEIKASMVRVEVIEIAPRKIIYSQVLKLITGFKK